MGHISINEAFINPLWGTLSNEPLLTLYGAHYQTFTNPLLTLYGAHYQTNPY